MKKFYMAAIASAVLFTGCANMPWNCDNQNTASTTPATTQPVAPQPQPVATQATYTTKVEPPKPSSCVISNVPGDMEQECVLRIEAVGLGVPPTDGVESSSQALVMARRAAILEGYKALAEKLYGVRINGRETLKNMMMQNEELRAYIQGVIRGAKIEEESFKNGMYKVVMSLKVNVNEWNRYLQNRVASNTRTK